MFNIPPTKIAVVSNGQRIAEHQVSDYAIFFSSSGDTGQCYCAEYNNCRDVDCLNDNCCYELNRCVSL